MPDNQRLFITLGVSFVLWCVGVYLRRKYMLDAQRFEGLVLEPGTFFERGTFLPLLSGIVTGLSTMVLFINHGYDNLLMFVGSVVLTSFLALWPVLLMRPKVN